MLAARVQQLHTSTGAPATDVLLAFAGRKQQHGIYHLVTLIGCAQGDVDKTALEVAGYWLVRRMFEVWKPTDGALAKLVAAVSRPRSKIAMAWTEQARSRALHRARRGEEDARAANPRLAAELGFDEAKGPRLVPSTKEALFDDAYRRRWNDLTHYYTKAAAAAAVGHGRLDLDSLARAGSELAHLIRIGDAPALHVGLEVETFLTSELVDTLLIVTGPAEPPQVCAWIDLTKSTFNRRLWWIDEKGARPQAGTEDMYERTSQICITIMSPLLVEGLSQFVTPSTPSVCSVEQLLGPAGHHPHARVAGRGRYKCTAARLQHSLPHAVLGQGNYRWPATLAVSAPFLVAAGRRAYGACRSRTIQAAANARYTALKWPTPAISSEDELIGGFVTPKANSISLTLRFLAEQADQTGISAANVAEVVDCLNAHAAWVAFVLALCLALRKRDPYPLPSKPLQDGESISFNDKDVHTHKCPPVPKARLLQHAIRSWVKLCESACQQLIAIDDPAAGILREAIRARLADEADAGLVFTIDATHQLVAASHHTWQQRLPVRLKLVDNFGRHFWPLQLSDLGVEQLTIDILMRHQFGDLHPGSSDNTRVFAAVRQQLTQAIDEGIRRIGPRVPRLMGAVS